MDEFKRKEHEVACGGYGWHWIDRMVLDKLVLQSKSKTRAKVRTSVRRTTRRKLKQQGFEEQNRMKW